MPPTVHITAPLDADGLRDLEARLRVHWPDGELTLAHGPTVTARLGAVPDHVDRDEAEGRCRELVEDEIADMEP